jgi:hypothetical protein
VRTNTDCTHYTKTIVAGVETWTRSVILAVHWENRKAANIMRSGLLEADSVSIYIPFARGSLVFKVGDLMVKSAVTDEIHALIPAIPGPPIVPAVAAFSVTDLKAKYPNTITIKSVDTKDFGSLALQHWQIGGS